MNEKQLEMTTTASGFIKKITAGLIKRHRFGLKYVGDRGFVPLPRNRLATISITEEVKGEQSTSQNYHSLRVTISGKDSGPIDSQLFTFDDFLGDQHIYTKSRGWLLQESLGQYNLSVVGYVVWDWYLFTPENVDPLEDAIADYITLWI